MQQVLLDGWVLRFNEGYTRRANSIHPLYETFRPLNEKLDQAEAVYQAKGMPVIFKVTAASIPSELDLVLDDRGYSNGPRVSVQSLDLRATPPTDLSIDDAFEFSPRITPDWFDLYMRFNPAAQGHEEKLRRMLPAIAAETCFGIVRDNGQVVSCGLGVPG